MLVKSCKLLYNNNFVYQSYTSQNMLIEINNFLSFYFVFAKKKHNKYNINKDIL